MTVRIDRRSLLAGAAGLAVARGARRPRRLGAGRAHPPDLVGQSANRNERTAKVIELFTAANPGVAVEGESAGWDDYWTRLATQTAGGNAPDVMQMDYRYIFEYARRGVLLPLDDAMAAGTLDLSGFSEEAIASGKVDGKTYGVSLGANSSTMIVNKAAFEEAGVALPERGITWDDYAARCAELTEKAGKRGFYGSADGGGDEPTFECWLRQRGKALYDAEGKLGFDAGDATEWFAMWQAMRDSGACVPADLQALDQLNIETSMVTLGHAAVAFAHTNQIVGFQAINQAPLVMVPYPTGGAGLQARPVPQAVDVLQRLRQHRRAGRGGEVRQLLHQRPGGDRGARRRARRAGVGGGARGALEHARRARQGADRVHREPRRPRRAAAAAAAGRRRRDRRSR